VNEQIQYEVNDSIATITLNRPERLNAWTARMGREMRDAFTRAEDDSEVVVIIMTGAGRGFCAGADLQTLQTLSDGAELSEETKAVETLPGDPSMGPSFRGPFSYPLSIRKPIVAAINGPCVGLGLPIALACDIRFASDRAMFSTAFARRGLIAEWGTSWMLPRIVGVAQALDLLLSARKVDASEAARMGLVNRVVPHDDLLRVTREYALEITRFCAPHSLAVIKREVLQHLTRSLHDAEQEALGDMLASFGRPDFAESLRSLAEQRNPSFGRLGS
jgi:enoyl-CoA hydratase/carnithine racemase